MDAETYESLKEENVKGELKWFADLIESPGDKHKKTVYSENKFVEELPPIPEKDVQLGSHDPDSESGFSKDRYTIKTCDIEIHHKIYGYGEGGITKMIGQKIDKQSGRWMETWAELTEPNPSGTRQASNTGMMAGTTFQRMAAAGGVEALGIGADLGNIFVEISLPSMQQ